MNFHKVLLAVGIFSTLNLVPASARPQPHHAPQNPAAGCRRITHVPPQVGIRQDLHHASAVARHERQQMARERRDMRADRHDLHQDARQRWQERNQLARDRARAWDERRELAHDLQRGHYGQARQEQRELAGLTTRIDRDKDALRRNAREMQQDRRDLRRDAGELRQDRQQLRHADDRIERDRTLLGDW